MKLAPKRRSNAHSTRTVPFLVLALPNRRSYALNNTRTVAFQDPALAKGHMHLTAPGAGKR